ncbi:sulfotransferase family 2 domain-containing protein [Microbulbifer elongatus]|uniref:sulfotransferase family 2 domain-containing protein n=1 Tax=Microbulbifer elongatus TaxID=86173 RepID=UPI001E2AC56B|nr:sulfotransferase family 2 domain-containing protein [Microbulbifer elongatus]
MVELKVLGAIGRKVSGTFLFSDSEKRIQRPRIFFCHIPKCAGSSIVSAVRNKLYPNCANGTFEIEQAPSKRSARSVGKPMMELRENILAYNLALDRNYFGHGHSYCRPELVKEFLVDWDFVTILRDPVERWISEYVYNTFKEGDWAKNTMSLEQYLDSKKGLFTGRYLLHYFSNESRCSGFAPEQYVTEALDNLSRFSVVGTLDRLDQWSNDMIRRYGVTLKIPKKNASPRSEVAEEISSDSKLVKKIERLCKYDLEVYNRVLDRIY